MLSDAAWIATGAILFTYGWASRNPNRMTAFHIANALGCFPLALLNLSLHVYPQVLLNASFGAVAWVALLREISRKRKKPAYVLHNHQFDLSLMHKEFPFTDAKAAFRALSPEAQTALLHRVDL